MSSHFCGYGTGWLSTNSPLDPWHKLNELAHRAEVPIEHLCQTVEQATFFARASTSKGARASPSFTSDLEEVIHVLSDDDLASELAAKAEWHEWQHPRDELGQFAALGIHGISRQEHHYFPAGDDLEGGATHLGGGGSSRPQWRPSLSRPEAEKWVRDSTIKQDLFHGTPSPDSLGDIAQGGIDPSRSSDPAFGNGFYLATHPDDARDYGNHKGTFKVDVRNPFVVDYDDPDSLALWEDLVQEKDEQGAPKPFEAARQHVASQDFDAILIKGDSRTEDDFKLVVWEKTKVVNIHGS